MNKFLNTDLKMLDRLTDDVNLTVNDTNTFIFMNNGTGNTKIAILDRFYSLRYKRYVTDCEITDVVDGVFFGRGIFEYE